MILRQMRERVIHARARLVRYHTEALIADRRVKHYEKTYRTSELGSAKRERQKQKLHDWRKRRYQLKQHIAHWNVIVHRRDEALKELQSETPRLVAPNLIEGGTVEERFYFWVRQGMKDWRDFYSEEGSETNDPWAVTNVPDDRYRSDCSKLSQKACQTIQVPDPTGQDFGPMFTGTVVANCQQVDRAYAESHPGTAVLFGSETAFHMGLSMAHGDLIVQHGVPELQFGTFDEFGPGTEVRFFKFLT